MPDNVKMILEVGSGKGNRFRILSARGRLASIDLEAQPEALRLAGSYGVDYLTMNAEDLAFADSSFDEVYSYDVIEHVENADKAVSELARVSRKGARLVIEVPHERSERTLQCIKSDYFASIGHRHFFNESRFRNLLEENGFSVKSTRRVNGIIALQLCALFLLGGRIESQCGIVTNTNRLFNFICGFFLEDMFHGRFHKYFFPVWILTVPMGRLISRLFPKSIHVVAVKT